MNILHFPKPDATTPRPSWMPFPTLAASFTPPPTCVSSQFAPLAGQRLLCCADDDNIRISCQNELGARFSYGSLAAELRRVARSCELHAVLTSSPADNSRRSYFRARGFRVLDIKREVITSPRGREVKSNADFDIVFEIAFRAALVTFGKLLLASGDGDLVLSIARGVQRVLPGLQVYTLSVRESTSTRILHHNVPKLIAGNLFVEPSMLRPLPIPARTAKRRSGGRHVS